MNKNVLLVSGKSATGKSASLRGIKDPEGVYYLNCEAGKELPFPYKFKHKIVTDPKFVPAAIEALNDKDDIHTIVIDTLTFLMDMYESCYVLPDPDTRSAWAGYAEFFKDIMQQKVPLSTKNIIFFAHTSDVYNENELVKETLIKVKGSLMTKGIESYFGQIIASKKVPTKLLEGYENPLLNITEIEEALGFKYVFQTNLTKETVNERIRSPVGMWPTSYTFIDNDIQLVLDHIHQYRN
jgi:hypothetical protein